MSIGLKIQDKLIQNFYSKCQHLPTSAWWNTTMPLGSIFLQSDVDFAVTPNPKGISDMLYTTTPVYAGVFSVILPSPDFSTWLPYIYCISAEGLTHICKERNTQKGVEYVMRECLWQTACHSDNETHVMLRPFCPQHSVYILLFLILSQFEDWMVGIRGLVNNFM